MKTTFKKEVKIQNHPLTATAIIEVTEDVNRKGVPFRRVNFVNTSPEKSFDAAPKFEAYEMELDELSRILNSEGFYA